MHKSGGKTAGASLPMNDLFLTVLLSHAFLYIVLEQQSTWRTQFAIRNTEHIRVNALSVTILYTLAK
jgi:hypothetical protein